MGCTDNTWPPFASLWSGTPRQLPRHDLLGCSELNCLVQLTVSGMPPFSLSIFYPPGIISLHHSTGLSLFPWIALSGWNSTLAHKHWFPALPSVSLHHLYLHLCCNVLIESTLCLMSLQPQDICSHFNLLFHRIRWQATLLGTPAQSNTIQYSTSPINLSFTALAFLNDLLLLML